MTETSATSKNPRETVFDVDVEKLARVYAQAALDAAGSQEDEVLEELRLIVTEVLDVFPDAEQIFSSALVTQDEKLGMLDRLFDGRLSVTTLSFLKVLARHGRLDILRQVVRVAGQLWEQRSNRVPVELELALELGESLREEVIQSLRSSLEIEPVVTTKINPDLIAGFVVRVGDKVYDASARTRLERTRQAMVANATEAIQSHPEQFISQES